MGRRGYITVDVDTSDVLDEVSDSELLEELADRKLSPSPMVITEADLARILGMLMTGRIHDAIATVDGLLSACRRCDGDIRRIHATIQTGQHPFLVQRH